MKEKMEFERTHPTILVECYLCSVSFEFTSISPPLSLSLSSMQYEYDLRGYVAPKKCHKCRR